MNMLCTHCKLYTLFVQTFCTNYQCSDESLNTMGDTSTWILISMFRLISMTNDKVVY